MLPSELSVVPSPPTTTGEMISILTQVARVAKAQERQVEPIPEGSLPMQWLRSLGDFFKLAARGDSSSQLLAVMQRSQRERERERKYKREAWLLTKTTRKSLTATDDVIGRSESGQAAATCRFRRARVRVSAGKEGPLSQPEAPTLAN